MNLHMGHNATGPISTESIHGLLSRTPKVTRLSFKGNILCFHIGQALDVTFEREMVCSELKCLDGTLCSNDYIANCLSSLSEALKRRPNIRSVTLDVIVREEEVERITAETG